MFTIGKVTGVHGIKGFVKVHSFAHSLELFTPGMTLRIGTGGEQGAWYTIVKASPHKKGLLVLFKEVDRNHAETLVGKELLVSRSDLPQPEEGTYYWQDLVGLAVTDRIRGEIGVVDHLFATGSNDVIVVKAGDKETLVPALAWVVIDVDLEGKTMLVNLPEGL
ncbi:MAG: ribosome maturation factor RimM [Desulfobacteraceae bacterium]